VRSLLDVNLLIAMFQPDHVHHALAHEWWAANRAEGWASCPLTQNGFVRIVSQPRYPKPVPLSRAIDVLQEATIATDHVFWADDISLLDEKFFNCDHILGAKQLTDIYLLALAMKNGGRLATFDRTIPVGGVRGAGPQHVVVV
jgi:uncharacterized protein